MISSIAKQQDKNGEKTFNPQVFFESTYRKMGIKSKVAIILEDNEDDKNNITYRKKTHDEIHYEIHCGVKGYCWNALTDRQQIKICNTIYHELVHVREIEQISPEIYERVNHGRSLACMGYKLLNEYVAYYEANCLYREQVDDLNSNSEEMINVFYEHMTKGFLTIDNRRDRTERDNMAFFDACYDNCNALIPMYILCGQIGDGSKLYSQFNKAVEQLASYYQNRKSLTVCDYEKIGREYIGTIIYNLSSSQRKIFWENTGIVY